MRECGTLHVTYVCTFYTKQSHMQLIHEKSNRGHRLVSNNLIAHVREYFYGVFVTGWGALCNSAEGATRKYEEPNVLRMCFILRFLWSDATVDNSKYKEF